MAAEERLRSTSPTVQLWQNRGHAREKMASMVHMGLHVFNPEWQDCGGAVPHGRMLSASFREVSLKLMGKEERLTFPVQTCTKVRDVKEALANSLILDADKLEFIVKQGCNNRKQLDCEEVARCATVKGITSFRPTPHVWPHPIGIIGSGYNGLKTMFFYAKQGRKDFVCFDRNERVGGYCWITAANKTSKTQTEFASFHVWSGHELLTEACNFPARHWGIWPNKEKILEHYQYAAEQYGILPHINFRRNVSKLEVVGDRNDERRHYSLSISKVAHVAQDGGGRVEIEEEASEAAVSVLYSYPGSMTKNRVVEYPGEDLFDGIIGYGMNDSCPYENLKGSNSAILGNGAFAVENVRTCCEYQCEKVYLVTRRKNLASPRPACWFVHQGPLPTPGSLLLEIFRPMYELCGFGDPWDFWSVHASKDRSKANIIQNSRFGIGDVTFLAIAYGKCEYVEDTLKRLTRHTLHLTGGRKLENVVNLLKSLGLLGDYATDRLHRMKMMVGYFCDGDWRRCLQLDATGMNAANFTTFSQLLGSTGFVRTHKYLYDFPREFYRAQGLGLLQQLPTHKAIDKEDKPACVFDVKYAMHASLTIETCIPKLQELGARDGEYKYQLYHAAHPLDYFLEECKKSWDAYQAQWKEWGSTVEYIPYPYTREVMAGFMEEYNKALGVGCSVDGPASTSWSAGPANQLGQVPPWAHDDNAVQHMLGAVDTTHKDWWTEKCSRYSLFCTGGKSQSQLALA